MDGQARWKERPYPDLHKVARVPNGSMYTNGQMFPVLAAPFSQTIGRSILPPVSRTSSIRRHQLDMRAGGKLGGGGYQGKERKSLDRT